MHQNVYKPRRKAVKDTHRENCALFKSGQEFIEIEAWLLLRFSLCLCNQLINIRSITTYWRLQMFEKLIYQTKMNGCFYHYFNKVYGKIWVGFCLNTIKRFFLETSFKANRSSLFQHIFMRQSPESLNIFNALILKQIFWKSKLFSKTGVPFFSWMY